MQETIQLQVMWMNKSVQHEMLNLMTLNQDGKSKACTNRIVGNTLDFSQMMHSGSVFNLGNAGKAFV